MTRFVVGDDRSQSTLFPERLDDYLGEDNPVWAIDVFVDELDLAGLGFGGVEPEATGRPAYHPATLLKIYVYGYLNRVQSSRRLERECQRNSGCEAAGQRGWGALGPPGPAFDRNHVRRNSLKYPGLRGEGSIPVPLPPPMTPAL